MRALAAEFIGTFALVFVGCGAVVVDAQTQGALGHGGICAAFGLVVAVMVFATGHISGAHFNPAVTLAFASIGETRWLKALGYIGAQCLAAVAGSAALVALIGSEARLGATVPSVGLGSAAVLEIGLTALLMFVITAVATDDRASGSHPALAIGGTVAVCALVAGPLTGASLNPARSLGPALLSGTWKAQWLYLIAPPLGAVLAAHVYRWVAAEADPRS